MTRHYCILILIQKTIATLSLIVYNVFCNQVGITHEYSNKEICCMLAKIVRTPTSSGVKLQPIRAALLKKWPNKIFQIKPIPVELQDRPDLNIMAQPKGIAQTAKYAKARRKELLAKDDSPYMVDISIENGIVWSWRVIKLWGHWDVAVVYIVTASGETSLTVSVPVRVPEWAWKEAKRRGFKTTTAGQIIHERYPLIPANNWMPYSASLCRGDETPVADGITREEQIEGAILKGLNSSTIFSYLRQLLSLQIFCFCN